MDVVFYVERFNRVTTSETLAIALLHRQLQQYGIKKRFNFA